MSKQTVLANIVDVGDDAENGGAIVVLRVGPATARIFARHLYNSITIEMEAGDERKAPHSEAR